MLHLFGGFVLKKILIFSGVSILILVTALLLTFQSIKNSLPKIITIADYKPLLVSQVYDKNNKKIGEYYKERRVLVPYEKIPKNLVNAFLAAEDDQFFKHNGINYLAILRATIANIKAGRKVQGGSTITQQLAKTLLLQDAEKTILRKIKDALLAQQIEANLKKEEILYLYLNQIYFGQGAYGIEMASQNYYRKSVGQLTLPEMAILAGLPQAPSRYSPVINPKRAKERQTYVLRRMADVGFISKKESEEAIKQPVKVYLREDYEKLVPYYLETVRQLLFEKVGEKAVNDEGIKIYTTLDTEKQIAAQEAVKNGLKLVDKRQGFRGPLMTVSTEKEITDLLTEEKTTLIRELTKERIIQPDGTFAEITPDLKRDPKIKTSLPAFLNLNTEYKAVVTNVDDALGLVYVQLPDIQGIINMDTMTWARKPNTNVSYEKDAIKKPSQALKKNDVILVKITKEKFEVDSQLIKLLTEKKVNPATLESYLEVELEQEPIVQGSLMSFDLVTGDVLAIVGGYDFKQSEFNRALQAVRQTGSSFKTIVYASALDKGYTPTTAIMDAPLVFDETQQDKEGQEEEKTWKPTNHSKKFGGDIIMRSALAQSLNVPTVKIIEDIGTNWAAEYAKRLGIFSKLNMDFTLALGSSSITLFELTKAYSQIGTLGKRLRPHLIREVKSADGQKIHDELSLDARYENEIAALDKEFEDKRAAYLATPDSPEAKKIPSFYFSDIDQLISPQTAYVTLSLLRATIEDKNGTGGAARALGREVAGKTGTTNGYFDGWFIGMTPQISTGVWVGFDAEKTLGKGEVGGRVAMPIWLEYMKAAHADLPLQTFPVPDGIVFANIDPSTGKLASGYSKNVIKQAYKEGTEPSEKSSVDDDNSDFYKQDLSE